MQKYYHKYQKALEAKGYTVDEHGIVRDAYGNQAAGEDRFGNANCSDPNITAICQEAEIQMSKPKLKPKAKPKKVEAVVEDGD